MAFVFHYFFLISSLSLFQNLLAVEPNSLFVCKQRSVSLFSTCLYFCKFATAGFEIKQIHDVAVAYYDVV